MRCHRWMATSTRRGSVRGHGLQRRPSPPRELSRLMLQTDRARFPPSRCNRAKRLRRARSVWRCGQRQAPPPVFARHLGGTRQWALGTVRRTLASVRFVPDDEVQHLIIQITADLNQVADAAPLHADEVDRAFKPKRARRCRASGKGNRDIAQATSRRNPTRIRGARSCCGRPPIRRACLADYKRPKRQAPLPSRGQNRRRFVCPRKADGDPQATTDLWHWSITSQIRSSTRWPRLRPLSCGATTSHPLPLDRHHPKHSSR
jgi:hypothetical protein